MVVDDNFIRSFFHSVALIFTTLSSPVEAKINPWRPAPWAWEKFSMFTLVSLMAKP